MSEITIAAEDIYTYTGDLVPAYAAFETTKGYRDSGGHFVQASVNHPERAQRLNASLVGNKIRVAAGTLYGMPATSSARGSLVVYDADGIEIASPAEFRNLRIPDSPSSTTWENIQIASTAKAQRNPATYLDSDAIEQRISGVQNAAFKASTTLKGVTKLDVDAADLNDPKAVGVNSPLVAVGTTGAAGRVKLDTAPADAANPIAVGSNSPLIIGPRIEKNLLSDYNNNLQTLFDDVGSADAAVTISRPTTYTNDIDFTGTNISFTFAGTGEIIADDCVVTLGNVEKMPHRKCFGKVGAGQVILGRGATPKVHLIWWTGLSPAGDQAAAFAQAVASVPSGGEIILPYGEVDTSAQITAPHAFTLTGVGVPDDAFPFAGSTINYTGSGTFLRLIEGFKNVRVRDCQITADHGKIIQVAFTPPFGPTSYVGLGLDINNVTFDGGDYAISIEGSVNEWEIEHVTVNNCKFIYQRTSAVYIDSINGSFSFNNPYILTDLHGSDGFTVGPHGSGTFACYNHTILGSNTVTVPPTVNSSVDGKPELLNGGGACFRVGGDHNPINVYSGQDEGMKQFLVNTHPNLKAEFNLHGLTVQAFMDMYEGATINIHGGSYFTHSIRQRKTPGAPPTDPGTPTLVTSAGYVNGVDCSGTTGLVPELCDFAGTYSTHVRRFGQVGEPTKFEEDVEIISAELSGLGDVNHPLFMLGSHQQDKKIFYLGQTAAPVYPSSKRTPTAGFFFYRNAAGIYVIEGTQVAAFRNGKINGSFRALQLCTETEGIALAATALLLPATTEAGVYRIAPSANWAISGINRVVATTADATNVGGNYASFDAHKKLINLGPGLLTIKHQDGAVTNADERFLCSTGGDIILPVNGQADVYFDRTTNRLRVTPLGEYGDHETALTPGATVALDASLGRVFTLTPAQDCTINFTNMYRGKKILLRVLTSGATPYNITFGTGARSEGVLGTGSVTAKYFQVEFDCNATLAIEKTRTGAM